VGLNPLVKGAARRGKGLNSKGLDNSVVKRGELIGKKRSTYEAREPYSHENRLDLPGSSKSGVEEVGF